MRGNANFNRLWAAQMLSAFGSRITRTALPIIAVGVLAVSPWEAAVLAALSYVPFVVAGLVFAGHVERANKTQLMIATDIARFLIVLAVPIAWAFSLLSFPLLCVIAALAGVAAALFANADNAVLPRLVKDEELVEANSRLQSTESLAELAGPGVAGVLIDVLTAPFAMLADALTFLWSAFWLRKIPQAETAAASSAAREKGDMRRDLAVGFSAIVRRPPLRAIMLAGIPFWISGGFFFSTFMLFMMRDLHLSPTLIGLIISVGGLSALAGSFVALPMAKRFGHGPALVMGFAMGVLGTLMLIPAAMIGGWQAAPFMVAQQLLGDIGMMVFFILSTSLHQTLLPEDQIARANGFTQAVGGGAMTVSILVAGLIAEAVGVGATVMMGAGIATLGVLPLLTRDLLGLRTADSAA
jgi:MFS family permease